MSALVCERQVFILRHQALSPQLGRLLPHPTLSITHSGVLQWLPSGSLASWVWVGMPESTVLESTGTKPAAPSQDPSGHPVHH